jgi:hypothetical protein
VAAETLVGVDRAAKLGEIKRLGKHPAVIPVAVGGGARIEVAASQDQRKRALGPFAATPGAAASSSVGL